MKITAIQIRRLENTGTKLKAIVTIVLDDMIAVHDIKVLQSAEDMFLAMPSRLTKQNTFQDVVHPIHSSVRKLLERLILMLMNKSRTWGMQTWSSFCVRTVRKLIFMH